MSMWDDEAGYDRDDPKHPAWAGTVMDASDAVRKQHRENGRALTPEGDRLVRNLEVYVNELRVVCASLDLLEAQLNAMKGRDA